LLYPTELSASNEDDIEQQYIRTSDSKAIMKKGRPQKVTYLNPVLKEFGITKERIPIIDEPGCQPFIKSVFKQIYKELKNNYKREKESRVGKIASEFNRLNQIIEFDQHL
jgi:hypothetical protein